MKAVWLGIAAAIVLAVVAGAAFTYFEQPSAQKFSTENVRVPG